MRVRHLSIIVALFAATWFVGCQGDDEPKADPGVNADSERNAVAKRGGNPKRTPTVFPAPSPVEPFDPASATDLMRLSNVAPEKPIILFASIGFPKADAKSQYAVERLLAEPQVQEFLTTAMGAFDDLINSSRSPTTDEKRPPADLIIHVANSPIVGYLAEFAVEKKAYSYEPALKRGGIVVDFRDRAAECFELVRSGMGDGGDAMTETVIDDHPAFVVTPRQGPAFTICLHKTKFLATVGEGEMEALIGRMDAKPPAYVGDLFAAGRVARPSSFLHVDIAQATSDSRLAEMLSGTPDEMRSIASVLGVQSAQSVAFISGLDRDGMVQQVTLNMENTGQGLIGGALKAPLVASDLALVPDNVVAALALKIDASQLLSTFEAVVREAMPEQADMILDGMKRDLSEFGRVIQGDVQKDLLDTLGDVWCLYTVANFDAGPVPQAEVVLFHHLKAPERFQKTLDNIMKAAVEQMSGMMPGLLQTVQIAGKSAYQIRVPVSNFQGVFLGCVNDLFVVTITKESYASLINRGPGEPSLTDNPYLARALAECETPIAIGYLDTASVVKQVMIMAPALTLAAAAAAGNSPDAQQAVGQLQAVMAKLPPFETLEPYMVPSTMTFGKTDRGLAMIGRAPLQMQPGPMIALLLPAVQAAREAARRVTCSNNLKQLALTMHNHHDIYNRLPAAAGPRSEGEASVSWRVLILPFMEQSELYDNYDFSQPWDSEHNLQLAENIPPEFLCPSSPIRYKTVKGHKIPCTNYVMVSGDETIGRAGSEIGFRDIRDGASNTIMFVEVVGDACPAWTEPVDLAFADAARGINVEGQTSIGSYHPGGVNVAFCDGAVRFLADSIDLNVLKALLTRDLGDSTGDF